MIEKIKEIIKPEDNTEILITKDKEFVKGVEYGKVRKGHPEGKVLYHIQEVLANVDKYYGDDPDRSDLRLLAIMHDSFKYKVDRSKPKSGANHHGAKAAEFANEYIRDWKLFFILTYHDEAYNSWQVGNRGDWNRGEKRVKELIEDLIEIDGIKLFIKFYKCDNLTGNKTNDDFEWFREYYIENF